MAGFKQFFGRGLEFIVLLLMTFQVVVVALGVSFRYAGQSLVWYDEVSAISLAWLTYFGAALAALHRSHIGFPGLMKWLPAVWRLPLYIAGEILVVGFFAIVFWYGYVVLGVLDDEYLISLPWVPSVLVQAIIPVGAVLFIVAEVLSMRDGWTGISPSGHDAHGQHSQIVVDTE